MKSMCFIKINPEDNGLLSANKEAASLAESSWKN
jgi:hypothetical protein